jgi:molecular chaperone DnaJ
LAPQREWFEKDYYAVLGVPDSASAKEIKSAYRKLSRQYHPDANAGDAQAEERFKEISAAYDVLGDDDKRKEYDEVRRLGPMANPFGGGGGGPGGFRFTTDGMGDLGDLFGGLFTRGRARTRGAGGAARGTGPQRGADLEADLQLSFEGAASGVETTVNLTSEVACSTCHGTGAKPGTTPRRCPVCDGRGVTSEDQGFFSFSAPCQNCRGQGFLIDDPCPTCRGTGAERKARQVKVRIPAGVKDGQRIRLAGRGAPGRNGGPPGDLLVQVSVADHPLFGRKGEDLSISVPITFPEAALGAEVAVPTLDGSSVTIKVPAGTRSGRTFRVKGKGIATAKRTGDLLVTVEVAVPAKLSREERKAVEALAALTTESPRSHLGVR